MIGETWGNHEGAIGESYGKLVKHCEPSHQHPQQVILGDGLRSTIVVFSGGSPEIAA